jgi:hypothetical protein
MDCLPNWRERDTRMSGLDFYATHTLIEPHELKAIMIFAVRLAYSFWQCVLTYSLVRLEPIIVELEHEQNDLLIISHASVIRCLYAFYFFNRSQPTDTSPVCFSLAYLIGLPSSEVPAVEIARGDLIQVTPTSYGVHSEAFHFWSGPAGHPTEYENYAESTTGKSEAVPTIAEHDEETASVKSVEEAVTFAEAAAIQKLAETGDTVFAVPVPGL